MRGRVDAVREAADHDRAPARPGRPASAVGEREAGGRRAAAAHDRHDGVLGEPRERLVGAAAQEEAERRVGEVAEPLRVAGLGLADVGDARVGEAARRPPATSMAARRREGLLEVGCRTGAAPVPGGPARSARGRGGPPAAREARWRSRPRPWASRARPSGQSGAPAVTRPRPRRPARGSRWPRPGGRSRPARCRRGRRRSGRRAGAGRGPRAESPRRSTARPRSVAAAGSRAAAARASAGPSSAFGRACPRACARARAAATALADRGARLRRRAAHQLRRGPAGAPRRGGRCGRRRARRGARGRPRPAPAGRRSAARGRRRSRTDTGCPRRRSSGRAGKRALAIARVTSMRPSSSGWRSASSTDGAKAQTSSRKSTPWWARLTSPGRGTRPPPDEARGRDRVVGRPERPPRAPAGSPGRGARRPSGCA